MKRRHRGIMFAPLLACAALALPACKERYVKVAAPAANIVHEQFGNGQRAEKGRLVTIRYKLTTVDGATTVLEDDSYRFEVGANTVIAAVEDAVRGMRAGGRRVVDCPPESHWGRAGYGTIPPNTPLRLEVELKSVQ
jgi:FK506-binding nuclear protein